MAELAVLTLIRNEVDDLHRAAERHDPAALAFWERFLGRAPGVGARLFFYTTARSNTRRICLSRIEKSQFLTDRNVAVRSGATGRQ